MIAGDDIRRLLLERLVTGLGLQAGDVLGHPPKEIVSKAEGRLVDLADVEPGEYAAWPSRWVKTRD